VPGGCGCAHENQNTSDASPFEVTVNPATIDAYVRPTGMKLLLCVALCVGFSGISFAQSESDFHHATFNVGGGFTGITGRDADRLDHGGNFQAGGGLNFSRYFSITGNFMFNQLGVTRSALTALNQPDGNARVYTFTADPTLRIPLGNRTSLYVLAGGGYLRRTVQFTKPTLAQTYIYDPWFGFITPVVIPVNQVLGSISSDAGVYDVGAGLNIALPRTRFRLYVESRYFHGFTSNSNTTIVPVTLGLRW